MKSADKPTNYRVLIIPMSTSLQDDTFVDVNEAGIWSEGYLIQASYPHSYVLSSLFPDGNLVDNDHIAPFRTRTNRSIFSNFRFVDLMKAAGDLQHIQKIELFILGESEFSEDNFVQVFAGALPMSLSIQSNPDRLVKEPLSYTLCRGFAQFYNWLSFAKDETRVRVWPSFWAAEQLFFEVNNIQEECQSLIYLHLQALADENCSLCILNSFPEIRARTAIDLRAKDKGLHWSFPYDLEVCGNAAKTYLSYCIRCVKYDEAIKAAALMIRCSVATKRNSVSSFVDILHELSSFFPIFPQLYQEKAEMLYYILKAEASPVLNIEDILGDQILDEATFEELSREYPSAAAVFVQMSVSKASFLVSVSSKIPEFPAFSSSALNNLLRKLTFKEQFEVCWALKGKRVLSELEWHRAVIKTRKKQRMQVIWTALVKRRVPLPKVLIWEIIRLI